MNTTWNKTNLALIMVNDSGEKVRLTFGNVVQKPADEQIKMFGKVVESLTNLHLDSATVATTDTKTPVA
ncbi:hypothetical protein [Secundilactobacillus odoratitofui]|nr:hypothetical protein [Secundilactobacillus odoratitofui]